MVHNIQIYYVLEIISYLKETIKNYENTYYASKLFMISDNIYSDTRYSFRFSI